MSASFDSNTPNPSWGIECPELSFNVVWIDKAILRLVASMYCSELKPEDSSADRIFSGKFKFVIMALYRKFFCKRTGLLDACPVGCEYPLLRSSLLVIDCCCCPRAPLTCPQPSFSAKQKSCRSCLAQPDCSLRRASACLLLICVSLSSHDRFPARLPLSYLQREFKPSKSSIWSMHRPSEPSTAMATSSTMAGSQPRSYRISCITSTRRQRAGNQTC